MEKKQCSVSYCDNLCRAFTGVHSKYCNKHAIQWLRHKKIFITPREKNTYKVIGKTVHIDIRNRMGEVVTITKIDLKYKDKVLKHKWSRTHCYIGCNNLKTRLHQFILQKKSGYDIDHINGDTLDNRVQNLRHATRQENTRNNHKALGVCWHKGAKKWRSYVRDNGKQKHLGLFLTFNEAFEERKKYAKIVYNEFSPHL